MHTRKTNMVIGLLLTTLLLAISGCEKNGDLANNQALVAEVPRIDSSSSANDNNDRVNIRIPASGSVGRDARLVTHHSVSSAHAGTPEITDTGARVANVDYVELSLSNTLPQQLTIVAHGHNDELYWSYPRLVPDIDDQPPADGMYDFTFAATPPPKYLAPVTQSVPITAQFLYVSVPNNFSGVRIHAKNNSLTRLLVDAPQLAPQTILSLNRLKTYASNDPIDIGTKLYAQGNVSSGGWFKPMLVPVA